MDFGKVHFGSIMINVAAVALANKNARVPWALLARGDRYRSTSVATPAATRLRALKD